MEYSSGRIVPEPMALILESYSTIELGNEAMRLQGVERPRIAMCGLNPHAGEHGLFGKEEIEQITPAIAAATPKGVNIDGLHAPDTIFLLAGARRL